MKNDDQLLSELKTQLDNNDRLKAWLIGGLPLPHKTILATTDKKLVRYRKTLTGFSFEAVPYAQISSINAGKGLFGHSVTALGANNFIGLGRIKHDDRRVEEFVTFIRQKISAVKDKDGNGKDISAQLTELNQLRQQGLITEEEFAAKKRKVLGI